MWTLDHSTGTLAVLTGVDGVAARMGHRLTIVMQTWHAEVTVTDDMPTAVSVSVEVDSLKVDHGEGGVTPLTAPERAVARSNALKSLDVKRFPSIIYTSETVETTEAGYRLTGELEIHGQVREHVVDLAVLDQELTVRTEVRQTDFGVKPYSLMMGSLRVADTVTVMFSASATGSHR